LRHIRIGGHAASRSSDFAANISAVRRPIPDAAPVIRIRRPWRRAKCVADIGLSGLRFSIPGFDIIAVQV